MLYFFSLFFTQFQRKNLDLNPYITRAGPDSAPCWSRTLEHFKSNKSPTMSATLFDVIYIPMILCFERLYMASSSCVQCYDPISVIGYTYDVTCDEFYNAVAKSQDCEVADGESGTFRYGTNCDGSGCMFFLKAEFLHLNMSKVCNLIRLYKVLSLLCTSDLHDTFSESWIASQNVHTSCWSSLEEVPHWKSRCEQNVVSPKGTKIFGFWKQIFQILTLKYSDFSPKVYGLLPFENWVQVFDITTNEFWVYWVCVKVNKHLSQGLIPYQHNNTCYFIARWHHKFYKTTFWNVLENMSLDFQ